MGDAQSAQGVNNSLPDTLRRADIETASAFSDGEDSMLMSNLVTVLVNRQSLLLSDLGALLPGNLRQQVKERGGLRCWLQRYPDLFKVSGNPGKECVMMAFDMVGASNHDEFSSAVEKAAEDIKKRQEEEDQENDAAVQMRGLPYRATKEDIKAFLGHHAANLRTEDTPIQLVLNRDGRPSGFARVQFNSVDAAKAARDGLHMGKITVDNAEPESVPERVDSEKIERYVEIFLFSERPNKLRFKKFSADAPVESAEDAAAANTCKEQVANELRAHMKQPGKGQLLLSMLGVALSSGSRAFLKRTDQGLKHFLSSWPEEWKVEGMKGRECVTYLPAMAGGQMNSDLPVGFSPGAVEAPGAAAQAQVRFICDGEGDDDDDDVRSIMEGEDSRTNIQGIRSCPVTPLFAAHPQLAGATGVKSALKPQTGRISALKRDEPAYIPESPRATTPFEGNLMRTPSDWGTPAVEPSFKIPTNNAPGVGIQHQGFAGGLGGYEDARLAEMFPWAAHGSSASSAASAQAISGNFLSMLQAQGLNGLQGMGAHDNVGWPSFDALGRPQVHFDAAHPSALQGYPDFAPAAPVAAQSNDEDGKSFAVRVRGLPLSSRQQDVLAFFARNDIVDQISDGADAVQMVTKANGKHTGQAVVHMVNRAAAERALKILNGQWIGARYIEVDGEREPAATSAASVPAGLYAAAPSAALATGPSFSQQHQFAAAQQAPFGLGVNNLFDIQSQMAALQSQMAASQLMQAQNSANSRQNMPGSMNSAASAQQLANYARLQMMGSSCNPLSPILGSPQSLSSPMTTGAILGGTGELLNPVFGSPSSLGDTGGSQGVQGAAPQGVPMPQFDMVNNDWQDLFKFLNVNDGAPQPQAVPKSQASPAAPANGCHASPQARAFMAAAAANANSSTATASVSNGKKGKGMGSTTL